MSRSYISVALRREVIERAGGCCEYCLSNTIDRGVDFAIDHVIAEKHGGPTQLDNLCLSYYWCNSFKGSDVSSVDWENNEAIVPLFNPRLQQWNEYFRLANFQILLLTGKGRVNRVFVTNECTSAYQGASSAD